MMTGNRKAALPALLMLIALCFGLLCGMPALADDDEDTRIFDSVEDLEGGTIAVITGTTCDQVAQDTWDDIGIMYVDTVSDAILALNTGKADAIICDGPYARYISSQDQGLACLDACLIHYDVGFAFGQTEEGQALCAQFNDCVAAWKADGTLDEMLDTWTDAKAEKPEIDLGALTGENGTLRFGTDGAFPPFTYVENNEYVGLEVDLIYRFCLAEGYDLQITSMNFSALITSVNTGKQDVAASCIAITPERSESVLFSDPVYDDNATPVVLASRTSAGAEAAASTEKEGFFRSVASSFSGTFITENRWVLFVNGIGQTLLITAASLLLGTLLGFALYMWSWTGRKVPKIITRIFEWLMSRMPMVVLLMILFYIVFAKTELSGTCVSIIGFTLVFGGSVFGLLQTGVGAVDSGQAEAGLALGYTRVRTFFRIVLPQAIRHIMPQYKGEVVALIKSTAIVGYVAVQDLTKVSDLVRSRTYEAFFPLIATAIIYLILAELLILLVSLADKRFFAANRTEAQILKGVKTDD